MAALDMNLSKVLFNSIETLINDKDLNIPSDEAKDAIKTADALCIQAIDPGNEELFTKFSSWLVISLKTCFITAIKSPSLKRENVGQVSLTTYV